MRHSQKAKYIVCTCMLAVGVFSAVILYRSLRPSRGLPYERITPSQAQTYMEFEEGYVLVDIDTKEEYTRSHIKDAINLPYDELLDLIVTTVPDKTRMIYLYGSSNEIADRAALKLSELGYDSVTRIGTLDEWTGALEGDLA